MRTGFAPGPFMWSHCTWFVHCIPSLEGLLICIDVISPSVPCTYTLLQLSNGRNGSPEPSLKKPAAPTPRAPRAVELPGSLSPSWAQGSGVPVLLESSALPGGGRILLYCSKHSGSVLATEANNKHYPVHNIDSVNWQVRCWTGLLLGLNCICTEHCLCSSRCQWERLHTG